MTYLRNEFLVLLQRTVPDSRSSSNIISEYCIDKKIIIKKENKDGGQDEDDDEEGPWRERGSGFKWAPRIEIGQINNESKW